MNRGGKFLNNCGAVLVGGYNRVILELLAELIM